MKKIYDYIHHNRATGSTEADAASGSIEKTVRSRR